jgi:hypothetical protein
VQSATVFAQKKINNFQTPLHQNVKGTVISIIPPSDFIPAPNFSGFQHNGSIASLLIMDIQGPYKLVSAGMSAKALTLQGIDIQKVEKIVLNGLPGQLIIGTQTVSGIKYFKAIMAFGNDQHTHMITGQAPQKDKNTIDNLRKALSTVYYDSTIIIDLLAQADYTIDITHTGLKLAKGITGSLTFTPEGQIPITSTDKTNLNISRGSRALAPEQRKEFCILKLYSLPLTIYQADSAIPISIDSLPGYLINARCNYTALQDTGSICLVILFGEINYYIFVAFTNDPAGGRMHQLQNAIHTFRRKKE